MNVLKVSLLFSLLGTFLCNAGAQAPSCLLDPSAFDTVIDGKPVALHTITNGRIYAQVTNYCGYIVGLFTPDRDGHYENVVGHNDSIDQYRTFSRNPTGPALGRYANRIGSQAWLTSPSTPARAPTASSQA